MSFTQSLDTAIDTYSGHVSNFQRYWKIARGAYGQYQTAVETWQQRFGYVVFLDQQDITFADVLMKFRAELPEKKQRVLIASSNTNAYDEDECQDDCCATTTGKVDLSFAGDFDRTVTIEGHRMRVKMAQASIRPGQATRGGIYFYTRSKAGRDAVVKLLGEFANRRLSRISDEGVTRDPNLFVVGRHGDWQSVAVPWRPIDSVILAEGQIERITQDLYEFLGNERFYVRRSIPWHRGYLFHGPPGTGKTSLVRALAKHFGLDLWTVPLGDLKKDSDLVSLVTSIRKGSILLLEDVDVYSAVRSRKQQGEKASLSGLLNALDGVTTPHGLITVLTTNHLDVIDPALLRPGRIDLTEELAAPAGEQLTRLFTYFYEEAPRADFGDLVYPSTAAVTEVFKQHLRDPRAAEEALLAGTVVDVEPVVQLVDVEPAPVRRPRPPRVSSGVAF